MGVYIYQSGTETELKNAYIGEVWTPGSNTIAYWELNGDTADSSNNGYDLSVKNGSISYGELTSGDKYGIFNGSTILNVAKIPSWSKGTVSFYVKKNNTSEGAIFVQNQNTNNSDSYTQISITQTTINLWRGPASAPTHTWSYTMGTSAWHHIVLTQDGTNMDLYIDGVKQTSWNNNSWFNYYTANQLCVGGLGRGTQTYTMLNGYLSNVIIESVARTAQEISHYYDITKANYGL